MRDSSKTRRHFGQKTKDHHLFLLALLILFILFMVFHFFFKNPVF
ncbi:hypothetical protein MuYL_1702 [Mucilaginibacter xinganensis]|uniref:Uncharacterized protein n=1 Tax=Mucilaginibacter xinganensis TaxID=1234841 RepID=A0A223NVD8_9SPHI|nr:hypothetical protein MuYL_1702 [Mucilaginibacter xinganensis]